MKNETFRNKVDSMKWSLTTSCSVTLAACRTGAFASELHRHLALNLERLKDGNWQQPGQQARPVARRDDCELPQWGLL